LATSIYAQQVGLKSISMLTPQPNAHYVRRNLLVGYHYGAELHLCPNIPVSLGAKFQLLRHRLKYGHFPQVIPFGGTSPLGTIGFVSAALELKEQIMKGEIPEPDRIYVASGSLGTATGLMIGLRLAGLKGRLISVRVTDEKLVNVSRMVRLARKVNSLLCSFDPSFPEMEFSGEHIDIRHDFFGKQYALFTNEGMEAVRRMDKTEGIKLDGTYTGKALAALVDDVKKQDLRDKVLLFWDTYNSRDFSNAITTIDYHQLPRCFHHYFEEDVQPLDRDAK